MTVYPQPKAHPQPQQQPQVGPGALFVFDTGRRLARWRLRSYHGPVTRGSVSVEGFGDVMVFPSPEEGEAFRKKHRRLAETVLRPITQDELLGHNAHTVMAIPAWFEVHTVRLQQFLSLAPEQQAGPEGRQLRWR